MFEKIKNTSFKVFYSENTKLNTALDILAMDESFLREAIPIIHFWPLENTVILGATDTRVPFLEHGLNSIENNNYISIVRNIGGLAIVSDEGVTNFSLILPLKEEKFSINLGYELMKEIIVQSFPEANNKIKAYEIKNSYCPGNFDLSIDEKKFAGIAQRRINNAMVVSIYISVFGNQDKRGNIIKEFYSNSIKNENTKFYYPKIEPSCMDNLSTLLGINLTLGDVHNRILRTFLNYNCKLVTTKYSNNIINNFDKIKQQLEERNSHFLNYKNN